MTSRRRSAGENRRRHAQYVRDEAPNGLGDGGGLRAGLGGVDEGLKGLNTAVLVDRDEGLAHGRLDGVGLPMSATGRGFLPSAQDATGARLAGSARGMASCFLSAVALVSRTTFSRVPVT